MQILTVEGFVTGGHYESEKHVLASAAN